MDPNRYDIRAKHKSLPIDFQYQDAATYKSGQDYIKENLSTYHYDKWKEESEGEWWDKLGRFELTEEIKQQIPGFIEESKKVGWFDVTSKYHPGFPGGVSPLLAQEDYDRKMSGIQGEFVQVVPEPNMVNTPVQQLGVYWKLKRLRTRIHVQFPGQMFAYHTDKLWHRNPLNPSKIIRMVVNLTDYEPGQIMLYGNSVLTQWRAGDVHCFDTLNIPHSTVNMSSTPRPVIVITGVRTDETDKLLSSCNKDTIHILP